MGDVDRFIGSQWLPDSEFAELFHWPVPDPVWLMEDECPHGWLPTDTDQVCGCWKAMA